MKIKCHIDGEIYEVLEEDDKFYLIRGMYIGIPIWIFKKDCEVLKEEK